MIDSLTHVKNLSDTESSKSEIELTKLKKEFKKLERMNKELEKTNEKLLDSMNIQKRIENKKSMKKNAELIKSRNKMLLGNFTTTMQNERSFPYRQISNVDDISEMPFNEYNNSNNDVNKFSKLFMKDYKRSLSIDKTKSRRTNITEKYMNLKRKLEIH